MSIRRQRVQAIDQVDVLGLPETFAAAKTVDKPEPDCIYSIIAGNGEGGIQLTGTPPELHHLLHRAQTELGRATGGPRVITVIDLSTGHLPRPICDRLNTYSGVHACFTGTGWLLTVPDDLAAHHADFSGSVPAEVWRLWQYAHRFSAEYILLNAGADRIDALPSWDW
ncbi:hypothetical protein ACTOB_003710 [Actinoplanes oblitus]|uniref:DUF5983 domain-containing protein n=1 Tax=Actinoplanes oblitus TaxID=3040509 RepID=A0ABY8WUH0_9ACTN|nr:hypothetical protein [Actinoplanes oblitus]WIN00035.1 hypothetical protein ACTOB_003710 [Actinoplanes oblitus]